MKRLVQTLSVLIIGSFLSTNTAHAQNGSIGDELLKGLFEFLPQLFEDYQVYQLKQKTDVPQITSLELMPHIGMGKNASLFVAPRIRGNWGLFSTDLRYLFNSNSEFSTLDWQVVNLNIVNVQPLTLRMGIGFMYEQHLKEYHPEYLFGLDIHWNKKHRVNTIVEWRTAKGNHSTRRVEVNARLNYKVIDLGSIHGFLNAGVIYQRWNEQCRICQQGNEQTNVWLVQSGMNFNLF